MSKKPDFTLKVGDRLPFLVATLINKLTGAPVDNITGYTVVFRYKLPSAAVFATIAATIVDGPKAIVSVPWGATDTTTIGDYDCDFKVTRPDTLAFSVPNEGCFLLRISEC